jgi:hypothetical protein
MEIQIDNTAGEEAEVLGFEQFIGQFPNWVAIPKRPRQPGDSSMAIVSVADGMKYNQTHPYYPPLH